MKTNERKKRRIKELERIMDEWTAKGKEHTYRFKCFEIELENLTLEIGS